MSEISRSVALTTVLFCGIFLIAAAAPVNQPAPRVVLVTAERFAFTPSDVTVPVGTEIEFRLKSEDTSHGFRILGHPVEIAIPKRGRGEATVRFSPSAPGRYVFECSRMCGAGHSFMRGTITVKPDAAKGQP
jgi:cytochrome c oxidase subunit II